MPNKKFDPQTIRKIAVIAIKNVILRMQQEGKYSPADFEEIVGIAEQYSKKK